MANLSKERRDRMMAKLEELKALHSDDESIIALNEIETALKEKKFGLVFEEHSEEVDEMLKSNIPVFTADPERRLCKDETLPWNFIIEGDNLQALYLLEKTHKGKVDCIYIDPPYNSGARDWKYNNDYVDENDSYRHSKWLSLIKKRLVIAKQLLNPDDSVLICTIDEKEYLHLGCLLEELFPNARIQMISDAINPKGVARSGFSRNDEYIFVVMLGECVPARLPLGDEWSSSATISADFNNEEEKPKNIKLGWTSMMRRGSNSSRGHSPGCYYPIYADPIKKQIVKVGDPVEKDAHKAADIQGLVQILPIRTNGSEGCWQVSPTELATRMKQGRIRLGKETSYGFVVNYLPDGAYKDIISDRWEIEGYADDGSIIAHINENVSNDTLRIAPTQWKIASHNASENGSTFIAKILNEKRFTYPKSIYAERDTINFFVANKPFAVVVDFFAGSGTTLHAVNLINACDNGKRKCIMVTNNEVSDSEEKEFIKNGIKRGDPEWEDRGIARYVTWPRTVCSIEGKDLKGDPLKGDYITRSDKKINMSDGFNANVKYYRCDWVSRTPNDSDLTELLTAHIREMIELENHIEVDNETYLIILQDNQADEIEKNWTKYIDIKGIYLSKNVLLTSSQNELFYQKPVHIIPDYYFDIEMKEVGESW